MFGRSKWVTTFGKTLGIGRVWGRTDAQFLLSSSVNCIPLVRTNSHWSTLFYWPTNLAHVIHIMPRNRPDIRPPPLPSMQLLALPIPSVTLPNRAALSSIGRAGVLLRRAPSWVGTTSGGSHLDAVSTVASIDIARWMNGRTDAAATATGDLGCGIKMMNVGSIDRIRSSFRWERRRGRVEGEMSGDRPSLGDGPLSYAQEFASMMAGGSVWGSKGQMDGRSKRTWKKDACTSRHGGEWCANPVCTTLYALNFTALLVVCTSLLRSSLQCALFVICTSQYMHSTILALSH